MSADQDVVSFQRMFASAVDHIHRSVIGQTEAVEYSLIGLVAGGHVLLEGVPGLAKTLVIKTLADAIHGTFSRIQFTPDMLPGDVVGTQIYNPREGTYTVKKGPVFGNFILADEINRAPAKVQSALLEAMQERQVTIDGVRIPYALQYSACWSEKTCTASACRSLGFSNSAPKTAFRVLRSASNAGWYGPCGQTM